MVNLAGRTALVSGAGRGFGKAIALELARAGASVTLISRTADEIGEAVREVEAFGGTAQAVTGDVSDLGSIRSVYAAHVAAFGVPDILVNCAGVAKPIGPIGGIDVEQWWATQTLNLRAPLQFMALAVPDMRKAGRGCIINITSIAGLAVIKYNSAYGVSKAALGRLSEHVAAENEDAGIAVFHGHPGVVFTRLMESESRSEEMQRWMPGLAGHMKAVQDSGGNLEGLRQCGAHCVALASGQYNHLSGKFLDFSAPDLEEAARRFASGKVEMP